MFPARGTSQVRNVVGDGPARVEWSVRNACEEDFMKETQEKGITVIELDEEALEQDFDGVMAIMTSGNFEQETGMGACSTEKRSFQSFK